MIYYEATPRQTLTPRRVIATVIAIAVAGAGVAWMEIWEDAPTRQHGADSSSRASTEAGARPATLVVSGDTAGWIVPCGCTANQSGGLLRRGTFVTQLRREGPVILADAGGAPGGTSAYQRAKFEAILDGEMAMGLSAHNLGEGELALGTEYLQKLARAKRVPFVSANVRDRENRPVVEPYRIIVAGEVRLALIGVLSKSITRTGPPPDWEISDPRDAVLEALAAAKGQFDRAVVLAYLRESELRDLAAALPEVDAVIGGPTGQSLAPVRVGPAVVASATNKGKFLVSLSLPGTGRGVVPAAEIVEMSAHFDDDPTQVENVGAFRRELARRDFDAAETGFAAPRLYKSGEERMAGSEACRDCHAAEYAKLLGSRHAQAWETLVGDETHVDPFCQTCHTTGYGMPGGFQSRAKSADRVAVGCESCHGPAEAHVEKPERRTLFAAREQCTHCHDHENSPHFEFATYWKKIAHGSGESDDSKIP